jgi:hypothetical protein
MAISEEKRNENQLAENNMASAAKASASNQWPMAASENEEIVISANNGSMKMK